MHPNRFTAWLLAALLGAVAPIAASPGDGHHHGASAAPEGSGALPRFALVSEAFELVGVLNGRQLIIYLDRFDDNSPAKGATVELELGGQKVPLDTVGDGEFEAILEKELKPALFPVTALVTAGSDTDLLAGELDLQQHSAEAEHKHGWQEIALWLIAALMALALVWGGRRILVSRPRRSGAR